jgi:hypothetical protein
MPTRSRPSWKNPAPQCRSSNPGRPKLRLTSPRGRRGSKRNHTNNPRIPSVGFFFAPLPVQTRPVVRGGDRVVLQQLDGPQPRSRCRHPHYGNDRARRCVCRPVSWGHVLRSASTVGADSRQCGPAHQRHHALYPDSPRARAAALPLSPSAARRPGLPGMWLRSPRPTPRRPLPGMRVGDLMPDAPPWPSACWNPPPRLRYGALAAAPPGTGHRDIPPTRHPRPTRVP